MSHVKTLRRSLNIHPVNIGGVWRRATKSLTNIERSGMEGINAVTQDVPKGLSPCLMSRPDTVAFFKMSRADPKADFQPRSGTHFHSWGESVMGFTGRGVLKIKTVF